MSEPAANNPYAAPPPTDFVPQALPPMGSVMQKSWWIYGNQWTTITAVVLATRGPIELIDSYLAFEIFPGMGAVYFVIVMALEMIGYPIATAGVVAIAIGAADGKPLTISEAIGASLRVFPKFFLTYLLFSIIVMAGFMMLLLPGIYLTVVLSLADSVVVQEGKAGTSAIGRSYDLVTGHFWRVFGICVVLAIITMSPYVILAITGSLVPTNIPGGYWIADAVSELVVCIVGAFATVCLYVVYRQLAEQRDGQLGPRDGQPSQDATSLSRFQ